MLDGLRDKLMAPDIAAEAVHAYVEETNRLNHQRRAAGAADRVELEKIVKAIAGLVEMAMNGNGTRAVADMLLELEAKEDAIRARIAEVPLDKPDIHPNIAEIYRRKVERLAEALNNPAERDEAADAIRGLIERVTLTPGPKRGVLDATLHGEFGAILEWVAAREAKECRYDKTPSAGALGVLSVTVVAGTGSFSATSYVYQFDKKQYFNMPGGEHPLRYPLRRRDAIRRGLLAVSRSPEAIRLVARRQNTTRSKKSGWPGIPQSTIMNEPDPNFE